MKTLNKLEKQSNIGKNVRFHFRLILSAGLLSSFAVWRSFQHFALQFDVLSVLQPEGSRWPVSNLGAFGSVVVKGQYFKAHRTIMYLTLRVGFWGRLG